MIVSGSSVVTKSNIHPALNPPSHFLANTLLSTMKKEACKQVMIPPDNSAKLLVCYSVMVRREIAYRAKQNKGF